MAQKIKLLRKRTNIIIYYFGKHFIRLTLQRTLLRSPSKFYSFDFLSTFLTLINIKLNILFKHQDMVKRTFIRLQLRKSSYDRVQSGLMIFSSLYLKKTRIDSIKRMRYRIRESSCDRVEFLAVLIPDIHTSFKQKNRT